MSAFRLMGLEKIRGYKVLIFLCLLVIVVQLYMGISFFSYYDIPNDLLKVNQRGGEDYYTKRNHKHSSSLAGEDAATKRKMEKELLHKIYSDDEVKKKPEWVKLVDASHVDSPIASLWNPEARRNKILEDRFNEKQLKCSELKLDAASAYNRATSDECKESVARTGCLLDAEQLFPSHLPRFCPLKGTEHGRYLGCFTDSNSDRDLKGPHQDLPDNTPEKCINLCLASGYNYAGVQYGKECWCGEAYGRHGSLKNSSCDTQCPGNAKLYCGGFNTQSIYKTGYGTRPANTEIVPVDYPKVLDVETSHMVRILFMLTLNGRAVRQVKRLFKAIYHVNHYYYIHVDARQDYLYREMVALAADYTNVRVVMRRTSTIWGGASLLEMLTQTMKEALAMTDWHWDFYLNLSESDYPVKTVEFLTAFLTANRNMNFLKSHGTDTPMFIRKQALLKTFYECDTHLWKIGNRTVPTGIRIDGGSDWICLNRNFVKYIIQSKNELVTGLREYFRYSLLGAESFFHTVLQNSEFCDTSLDNNLHKTNWNRKRGCLCQYKHIVDWCGCSPMDFTPKDIDKLKKTEHVNTFFARKFEAVVSSEIVNQVDEWVHGPYTTALSSLPLYWQSIWHSLDEPSPGDDAQYTYYMSFAHNALYQLEHLNPDAPECSFSAQSVQETHLFNEADSFSGLLISFTADHPTFGSSDLEVYVKRRSLLTMVHPVGLATRLRSLAIGAQFDMKERIYRDFGQLLSWQPKNLTISHIWDGGVGFNVTLLVVDPLGQLATVAELEVPTGMDNLVLTRVHVTQPMLPGKWKAKIVVSSTVVAEREFLILPPLHDAIKAISDFNMSILQVRKYPSVTEKQLTTHISLLTPEDKTFSDIKQLRNIFSGGIQSARNWAAEQLQSHWTSEGVCTLTKTSCSIIPKCEITSWSSKGPDPKSGIGAIDPKTGRISRN